MFKNSNRAHGDVILSKDNMKRDLLDPALKDACYRPGPDGPIHHKNEVLGDLTCDTSLES